MPKTILVIDDNEGDQTLIREAFVDQGLDCEVHTANTGEEGVEKARTLKPHVVILDTQLPGADGFATCRKIKALEGVKTKVVMLTGVVDAVNATEAREAGSDDYCVKTADLSPLLDIIKKFV